MGRWRIYELVPASVWKQRSSAGAQEGRPWTRDAPRWSRGLLPTQPLPQPGWLPGAVRGSPLTLLLAHGRGLGPALAPAAVSGLRIRLHPAPARCRRFRGGASRDVGGSREARHDGPERAAAAAPKTRWARDSRGRGPGARSGRGSAAGLRARAPCRVAGPASPSGDLRPSASTLHAPAPRFFRGPYPAAFRNDSCLFGQDPS